MAFKELLERAAITNTKGRIGNPTPGYVFVPGEVEFDPGLGVIQWNLSDGKEVKPPEDLIDSFAALFDQQPAKILTFAKRYGVLGLNSEGVMPERRWLSGNEPIVDWRSISSRIRSILRLAAMLDNGEPIIHESTLAKLAAMPRRDLQLGVPIPKFVIGDPTTSGDDVRFGEMANYIEMIVMLSILDEGRAPNQKKMSLIGRHCLDMTVAAWLRRFPTKIATEGGHGRMEVALEHGGLLSVISLQLLQAVCRRSIYICSECKTPFVRHGGSKMERRPKTGMDRFCDQCGRRAAVRRADARRREKVSKAKGLSAAGLTVKEIASRLGVRKVTTVSGWIAKGS
jgi:hypothetical protein